jgi:hypothetical protein
MQALRKANYVLIVTIIGITQSMPGPLALIKTLISSAKARERI